MTGLAERKVALQLMALDARDRSAFLDDADVRLSAVLRILISELEEMSFPVSDIACTLLEETNADKEKLASLPQEALISLANLLSSEWLARALLAFPEASGPVIANLPEERAREVKGEMERAEHLAPYILTTLRREFVLLADGRQS